VYGLLVRVFGAGQQRHRLTPLLRVLPRARARRQPPQQPRAGGLPGGPQYPFVRAHALQGGGALDHGPQVRRYRHAPLPPPGPPAAADGSGVAVAHARSARCPDCAASSWLPSACAWRCGSATVRASVKSAPLAYESTVR
jgi:hypothetical protein